MDLMTVPRTLISGSIAATKWPMDTGLRLIGQGEGPAAVTLDRLDGMARSVIGGLLGDDRLQQDGVDRLTAAEERAKAQRLRVEAELRRERATEEQQERRQQAAETRAEATRAAERQRERAEERKQARKRQAADTARKRKQQSAKAEQQVEEVIEDRAKRERLETLDEQAAALDREAVANTARDEAQRLADAASAAKAARKNGGA